MHILLRKSIPAVGAAALLAACGGGGSGSAGNSPDDRGANAPPAGTLFSASCEPGSGYQCSGTEILRIDNGVAATAAGVQVYGVSTSDLQAVNQEQTTAYGLALPSSCASPSTCGIAEVRMKPASNGEDPRVVLILDRLGLRWDNKNERPRIIDTFSTEMGRATIDQRGVVHFSRNLPPSPDLDFYDYAVKGKDGTQANYANNVYFPRSAPPVRCPQGNPDCPVKESDGVSFRAAGAGSWRSGGVEPDMTIAGRLHSDGDLCAGDAQPGPDGERRFLSPGCNGFGSAFPGFKGYRTYTGWSYQYATLASWLTQDTVKIVEWTADGSSDEHNKIRRGLLAFGEVAPANALPASGAASYSGIVYGYHVNNGSEDVAFFRGRATVDLNFATGQASIIVDNTVTFNEQLAPVPAGFSATATLNAAMPSYLSGTANQSIAAGGMQGGISARLFGPAGTTGSGPAEIGGTFSMSNSSTGQTSIGGFIARRQ